jgi:hypothetical protein
MLIASDALGDIVIVWTYGNTLCVYYWTVFYLELKAAVPGVASEGNINSQ